MKSYITISREFGSCGHLIGSIVAKILNVPFYDSEIINLAAKDSGLSPDFIKQNEQNISSNWLYTLLVGSAYSPPMGTSTRLGMNTMKPTVPLADQIFNAQRNTIIELAKKGSCVIVGRCSDYVLRHCEEIKSEDVLNVFIYAPLEDKIKFAVEERGIERADAPREIALIDKHRANHYSTFTESTWGSRENYDLLINSSLLGIQKTAELIAQIAQSS